jgi:hypothetical protein
MIHWLIRNQIGNISDLGPRPVEKDCPLEKYIFFTPCSPHQDYGGMQRFHFFT